MLQAVKGAVSVERLAVHFHDTYGQALANILVGAGGLMIIAVGWWGGVWGRSFLLPIIPYFIVSIHTYIYSLAGGRDGRGRLGGRTGRLPLRRRCDLIRFYST
jgi:hypothetical protein